jgi:predicted helicase
MRKALAEEFSNIYIFHLRGNQRTVGEQSRREGGKIFGSGSRSPIAITLLVKNPAAASRGNIWLHDIGDYQSREQKLETIAALRDVSGIEAANGWVPVTPDSHGDWLKQRDAGFEDFIVMGDKQGQSLKLFKTFSLGVVTSRDAWCFNASRRSVAENMGAMIAFYDGEVDRFQAATPGLDRKARADRAEAFIDRDPKKVSWSSSLIPALVRGQKVAFRDENIVQSVYRPYTKQWLYHDELFNHRISQMPSIFPKNGAPNRAIMIKQRWAGEGQLALMIDRVAEFQTDGGSQCFPLYLYEPSTADEDGLFESNGTASAGRMGREFALTRSGLDHFGLAYPGEAISEEDVFYYVYGLLHSEDYRSRYADNLSKELPRIPRVKSAHDFWAFSQAGRLLAELHLNYESAEPFPATLDTGGKSLAASDYSVVKMKIPKKGKVKDLATLVYNSKVTVRNIPAEAYDYVVNGKPALDWVIERQCVKSDKDSGISNDANDWAVETMGNPRYPLELFLRMVTVSLETTKIVRSLPKLDI